MTQAAAKPEKTYFYDLHQIAVACDLLPFSNHAFKLATHLAHSARAELTAIHIVPPIPTILDQVLFPYAALGADRHDFEAELLDVARNELLATTNPIVEAHADGQEIYAHILHGDIVERTREALQRTSAELFFAGAYGARPHPGGAASLGTHALRLAANALRPTLLVKDSGAPAFPRRVLCALDLSAHSRELLNFAVSYALRAREGRDAPTPELHLATVIPDPAAFDPADLLSDVALPKNAAGKLRKRIKAKVDRLRELIYIPFPLSDDADTLGYTHHIPFGEPVDALLTLIEELDIDTLVIASQHPQNPASNTLGRNAERLLQRVGCNVLLIPSHLLTRPDPTA